MTTDEDPLAATKAELLELERELGALVVEGLGVLDLLGGLGQGHARGRNDLELGGEILVHLPPGLGGHGDAHDAHSGR